MLSLPGSQCRLERLGRWGNVFPNLTAPLTWITAQRQKAAGSWAEALQRPWSSRRAQRHGGQAGWDQHPSGWSRAPGWGLQTSKLDPLPVPGPEA